MANKVLAGYVTRICEIYIDDVLLFGTTDNEYLGNTRKVLGRLREKKVAANPDRTRLGLKEVEYVGHLISSTGTSFTDEKRLQVLNFPLPKTEKALLQFIELVNYFRDHVPKMTEMVQPLRKLMDMKKYKGSKKLTWADDKSDGPTSTGEGAEGPTRTRTADSDGGATSEQESSSSRLISVGGSFDIVGGRPRTGA
jgi:hypothetical protein